MKHALFCLITVGLAGQAPQAAYVTRPSTWHLEVQGLPGGWTSQPKVKLTLGVVDPTDPSPPSNDRVYRWSGEDDEGEDASWDQPAPKQAPDAWPNRPYTPVIYWFNGEKQAVSCRIGYGQEIELEVQNGENRLEVLNPESGRRTVRTWWSNASRHRLLIQLSERTSNADAWRWWGGGLQVVEPDHTESISGEPTPSGGRNQGDRYVHPAPVPGTYTVRWFDSSQGVDGYEWGSTYYDTNRKPAKILVEVFLDPGTEFERRWHFERLITPGTRRVTLGSFDIED